MTKCLAAVAFVVLVLAFVRGACAGQSATRLENAQTSASAPPASRELAAWEFDSERDLQAWQPNAHLKDVTIAGGTLRTRAVDWDPFLLCRQVQIDAGPRQYVVVRMKASRPGVAELFWSGQLEGQYGGLTEAKKLRFSIDRENQWQEFVLFPFWHTERVIRQLRLDLYEGTDFEIDGIRIEGWGQGLAESGVCAWSLGGDLSGWRVHPAATESFAPPTRVDVSDKKWVSIELASNREDLAAILWACENRSGLQSEDFSVRGDGRSRFYNIPMTGAPAWTGPIVAFGIRLPAEANARIGQVKIGSAAFGPGELEVNYFGFENGVNRAGRSCKLLAQVISTGGDGPGIRQIHLQVPEGLSIVSEPETLSHRGISFGNYARFVWEIRAEKPGVYPVYLSFTGKGVPPDVKTTLEFTSSRPVRQVEYVPPPKPVQTDIEICAFYFPGWESDGKPAVFIWDPRGIRNDLGGSQAVRKAFDKSQEMARTAGFGGITLIALGYDFSEGHIRALKEEGYFGVTTYHEWGPHIDGQVSRKVFHFEDVVRDSPTAWRQKNTAADGLVYYPLVDTGWDSRPWHGHKAMTIRRRTTGQFRELLRQAALFCRESDKRMLILGPVNEWGEGSYIEPCTEFGFEMLEAVRSVFAAGSAADWPTNIAPSDVGLGPYDFPPRP